MTPRLALAGLVLAAPLLGAASCETDRVKLAPIPPPAAIVVKVPTPVALPADLTAQCPEPQARPMATDIDLYIAAADWRRAAKCANGRLKAIQDQQP